MVVYILLHEIDGIDMNEEEANNKFNSLSENHQLFLELW